MLILTARRIAMKGVIGGMSSDEHVLVPVHSGKAAVAEGKLAARKTGILRFWIMRGGVFYLFL